MCFELSFADGRVERRRRCRGSSGMGGRNAGLQRIGGQNEGDDTYICTVGSSLLEVILGR